MFYCSDCCERFERPSKIGEDGDDACPFCLSSNFSEGWVDENAIEDGKAERQLDCENAEKAWI